jgi:hypothetical protein
MTIEGTLLLCDLSGMTEEEAIADIAAEFEESIESLGIKRLLIGEKEVGPWGCDSSAWFLFIGTDGNLYEVYGSHCSCYDFEGQWEPKGTSWSYLLSTHCPNGRGEDGDRMTVRGRIRELFDSDDEELVASRIVSMNITEGDK